MQQGATITGIELYKLLVPLKEPFVISLGPVNSVQNVVVIIRTQDGCTGYGECSPFLSINGESMDTCFIVGQYFAKALKGTNALDLLHATQLMDRIIYANSSIKSAFDMALHDIAAQHAGLPLYRFLGGEKNKELTTDMTVGLGAPDKMQADAIRFKEQGFPAIKVKLGEGKDIDVARIKAIRDGIGMDTPLRIDANQGWPTAAAAIAVLKALEPYNIQHCEEPIPRHNLWSCMRYQRLQPSPSWPMKAAAIITMQNA